MSAHTLFSTEASLVDCFLLELEATDAFDAKKVVIEWDHSAGYVDVLVRDGRNDLIAFEAKLRDWRKAVLQAYRSTAYANRAYVLMPEKYAMRAVQHRDEFVRRGVGLCAMRIEGVRVLIEAPEQPGLLKWLRTKAHEYFDGVADDSIGTFDTGCGSALF